jgi:hypothetical protein
MCADRDAAGEGASAAGAVGGYDQMVLPMFLAALVLVQ